MRKVEKWPKRIKNEITNHTNNINSGRRGRTPRMPESFHKRQPTPTSTRGVKVTIRLFFFVTSETPYSAMIK
jgi:hypothetical protein